MRADRYTNGRLPARYGFTPNDVSHMICGVDKISETFTNALANVLRHELLDARMTKKALAGETGIGLRTLDRYMEGERAIPIDSFWKICRALNASASDIFQQAESAIEKDM
jgi:DNA-binding Xre family transcriptional regulator